MMPCWSCAGNRAVVAMRAQGKNTHFVVCKDCGKKTRDFTTARAAVAAWEIDCTAKAEHALKAAARQLKHKGSALRRDPGFIAVVLGRYVGYEVLEAGGKREQVMRMPIHGEEYRVNLRAFVDGWLIPQPRWADLAHLADPERVVHYVLEDADHGTGVKRKTPWRRETGTPYAGTQRPTAKIGGMINAQGQAFANWVDAQIVAEVMSDLYENALRTSAEAPTTAVAA